MLAVVIVASAMIIYIKIRTDALELEIKQQSAEIKNSYGVDINYRYSPESFFPRHPSANGSQAWIKTIHSTLPIVGTFLSKYPRQIIRKNLSAIFFLGTLEINGKSYGGTYIGSAIYIPIGGLFYRNSDSSLLGLMHAEFSSILFHKYPFPKQEWDAVNKPGWRYIGSGSDMLGTTAQYEQTDDLRQNGFLEGYSQASIEEDFNIFVEWVFTKPDRLARLVSRYERIKRKYDLVIRFYDAIDPKIDIRAILSDAEASRMASPQ